MITFLLLFLSLLFPNAGFEEWQADLFELEDLGPHPLYVNELQARKNVEIHPGFFLPAELNVSSKGNGILTIANLEFQAFDSHGDGGVFRNKLLNIKLVDFSRDGYKDLVVYGLEDEYDEKEEDKKIGRRFILHIYRYSPAAGKFDLLFSAI